MIKIVVCDERKGFLFDAFANNINDFIAGMIRLGYKNFTVKSSGVFESDEYYCIVNLTNKQGVTKMTNINLSREVYNYYFCDEYGNPYTGHPDLLCVPRNEVVKQFPETADWPIVGEHSDRFGYVLGNGIFLFPDFNLEDPKFEAI